MSWTETQARALGAAFAALDAAGIDWMVLRNHQGLPEANRSKDVDLGMEKSDFRRAERAISAAVAGTGFDRVLVEDFQYVRCLTFFGLFDEGAQSIKIDLLDGFVFRGAQVFAFPELFAAARQDAGFIIPGAADDAVMLWAKPLLTGGIVKPKYVPDIRRAVEDRPEAFRAILERIFTADGARAVWDKLRTGDIEATIPMKRALRRSAWQQAFRRRPAATLRAATLHVVYELARRLRRNPASFVSVAGPDGVGKSTFIENLGVGLAELQVKDHDAIVVEHFRPRLLPNINTLLTGKVETVDEDHDPHRAEPASMPSSLLRIAYYWVDYVVGYWGKLRGQAIRGQTIVFDRYFFDFVVDPRRSRLSLPAWVPRAFLAFTPKPDLVFFLDADAEEIYARKQELPLDEIARQLDRYRALADRFPDRFVRLDAGQAPEKVAADALRAVVTRCYRKVAR